MAKTELFAGLSDAYWLFLGIASCALPVVLRVLSSCPCLQKKKRNSSAPAMSSSYGNAGGTAHGGDGNAGGVTESSVVVNHFDPI